MENMIWSRLADFVLGLDPWILAVGGLAILGAAIGSLFGLLSYRRARYEPQRWLFTQAEKRFMRALQSAVGGELWIGGKVRIADVVKVEARREGKAFWRAFRQISSKHVDFVLCNPKNFEVLAVVELDDRSHERPDRRKRDVFVDRVFAEAKIPILRFKVCRSYSPADVRRAVLGGISAGTQGAP